MFSFSKSFKAVFGGIPEGYAPCYRCTVCRTCGGKGRTKGGDCPACAGCKKCEGTRIVPDPRTPVEDAEVVLARVNVLKRPMLEHLAMFLSNQPEGDIVFERLVEKRKFRLQGGEYVTIHLKRHGKVDDNDPTITSVNIEEEADTPPEVPEEAPL